MARCWTCGAYIERPLFKCPNCRTVDEIQRLRDETADNFDELAEVQRRGFEKLSSTLSEGLSNIASAIEWGFQEVSWQLKRQTQVLKSIDKTLKTPTQTQANEWRQIAEDLKSREVLDKSEEFFQKSLDANPLDYRTYVGLAETYLQMDEFEKAEDILEGSIPHAPKGKIEKKGKTERVTGGIIIPSLDEKESDTPRADRLRKRWESYQAEKLDAETEFPEEDEIEIDYNSYQPTDYKSYSYRLIGHIHACREDYSQAVSVLQKAVELSPTYYIAFYDLAKYSAQAGKSKSCISVLKTAIEADPFFFELAEKDQDLSSVREVIEDIEEGAQRVARQAVRDAEAAIKKAEEVGAKDYASTKYQKAISVLQTAKSKMTEATYRAFLIADRLSSEAREIANQSKEEAEQKKKIEAEKKQALEEKLKWNIPWLLIKLIFGVCSWLFFVFISPSNDNPVLVVLSLLWMISPCVGLFLFFAGIWEVVTHPKKRKYNKDIEKLRKADGIPSEFQK